MIAPARKPRALRRPPPDTATVIFVPLPIAAPGQPKGTVQLRAERGIAALLELGGYQEPVAKAAP